MNARRESSRFAASLYWLAALHYDDASREAWRAHLAGVPMTWLPLDFFDLKARKRALSLPNQDRRQS